MFGDHFYHQRIRKAVAVFGSLCNNINIVRQDGAGKTLSQQKVPLSYAPKRDFLARIESMQNGEDYERQVALKLPRISFEILAMNYDATRQLPKMNNCVTFPSSYNGKGQRVYSPVPYIISFQLNAYAKTQDDALQIVEQILPYFTPHYTVTVKPLNDLDIKEDTPITMTGITFSDDYEAAIENRRTIIYTLDFDMKINLYKDVSNSSAIIEEACVEFLNLNAYPEEELFSKVCLESAFAASPLSIEPIEEVPLTVENFMIKNIPSSATSITVSDPLHGTASGSLTNVLTSTDGVISAVATYTYTSDIDYSGLDSFNINVLGDFGSKLYPIAVNVAAISDAINDVVNVTLDTPQIFNVATNDLWTNTTLVFSLAAGGDPLNGSVEVLNSATGQFRYTPNVSYTGTDSFVYRVTPEIGTSEVATVNITVS